MFQHTSIKRDRNSSAERLAHSAHVWRDSVSQSCGLWRSCLVSCELKDCQPQLIKRLTDEVKGLMEWSRGTVWTWTVLFHWSSLSHWNSLAVCLLSTRLCLQTWSSHSSCKAWHYDESYTEDRDSLGKISEDGGFLNSRDPRTFPSNFSLP